MLPQDPAFGLSILGYCGKWQWTSSEQYVAQTYSMELDMEYAESAQPYFMFFPVASPGIAPKTSCVAQEELSP